MATPLTPAQILAACGPTGAMHWLGDVCIGNLFGIVMYGGLALMFVSIYFAYAFGWMLFPVISFIIWVLVVLVIEFLPRNPTAGRLLEAV